MRQQTLTGFERYGKTTASAVSGGHVPDCAMGGADGGGRAVLSEDQRDGWSSTIAAGTDVAGIFSAAVVQPVGPGGRGSLVRVQLDAELRRHRSGSRSCAG